MKETPITIKTETNIDAKELLAQRVKELKRKYQEKLNKKAYPYLYDTKNN